MAANDGWKVSYAKLPEANYMMPKRRKVRTKDGVFQVQVDRTLPLPCGSFTEWVAEMQSDLSGLVDVDVDYMDANSEYSTEILATGWKNATPEQVEVLKEHDFSQ